MTSANFPTIAPGIWLSSPNVTAAEMSVEIGYRFVVLDIEHGHFDLRDLEFFVPVLRGLKLEILAKVLAPERAPIQQALDFGADGVIIPHVEDLRHAAAVTRYAKFAPLGERSFAGGRPAGYGGFTDDWVQQQNDFVLCLPMIERADSLADIDAILALPTVDGVFVGPSDLSLSRARGGYARTAADFADIETVATAAHRKGKSWGMGAWAPEEKELCVRLNASRMVCVMEHVALKSGLQRGYEDFLATLT
jgi:4-hydroxy-2-oxoheptanedioate aldolase